MEEAYDMKVYLLYSNYDDGAIYEKIAYSNLKKIVDSEDKAKQWIFEHSRDLVNDWIAKEKERLKEFLRIDEDGPYYEPFTDDLRQEIMDDIQDLEYQIPEFNPCVKKYVLYSNFHERFSFSYKEMEVE